MPSTQGKLTRLYADNGLILGTRLLLDLIAERIRSWLMNHAFGTQGMHVGPRCHIRGSRYISIGSGFFCKGGLWLEAISRYREQGFQPRVSIGRNVSCSEQVHISCIGQLTIGNDVLIGSGVYIGDHTHGQYRGPGASSPDMPPGMRPLSSTGPLLIGDRVFIGDKVTIAGGLTIGNGSIIAANSVVTSSLPPACIAAGIPARVIRIYDPAAAQWLPA